MQPKLDVRPLIEVEVRSIQVVLVVVAAPPVGRGL